MILFDFRVPFISSELDCCTREGSASSPAVAGVKREGQAHVESRLTVLTDALQSADGKALLFSSECLRMKERLALVVEQKAGLASELSQARQQLHRLTDELGTSVRNYETQLETMSEHLATMTERWSKQQIELDSLRLNLSQRVSLALRTLTLLVTLLHPLDARF